MTVERHRSASCARSFTSPMSRRAAVVQRGRDVSASSSGSSTRPPDTPDALLWFTYSPERLNIGNSRLSSIGLFCRLSDANVAERYFWPGHNSVEC